MDKETLILFLKSKIAVKFGIDGCYNMSDYSSDTYNIFSSFSIDDSYDKILYYLDTLKNIIDVDDSDINKAYEVTVENKYLEEKLENLIYEKRAKGYYEADDIALVRDTDYLPFDGCIPSISNVPFVCKCNLLAHSALASILYKEDEKLKQITKDIEENSASQELFMKSLELREKREMEIGEEIKKFTPYSSQYRSTVHFCLNGIVSSHQMGTFNGKYVIIEPFSEHYKDSNIEAVRPEDTYFKEKLMLSDKAKILVNKKDYEEIINFPGAYKYNIVFYEGSKKDAVNRELIKMGIVPEKVETHNIAKSKTSDFISKFIEDNGYEREKHCFSSSYKEDDDKSLILWPIYEKEFFKFLDLYVDDVDVHEKLNEFIENYYSDKFSAVDIMVSIIKEIGLEKYKYIVSEFNSTILEKVKDGTLPTNNEILSGEKSLSLISDLDRKL